MTLLWIVVSATQGGIGALTDDGQQADVGGVQAARLLSGRGGVKVDSGDSGTREEDSCKSKSSLGRPSYHVYLALGGQRGKLDVCGARLGRLVRWKEASPVNQAGWHGCTQHRTTVDTDVSVAVRVGDVFSALS